VLNKIFGMLIVSSILFIAISFSTVSAEDLPKYRMVELGVFGTDQSNAIAVNEKGQVLGTCWEGNHQFIFLWDELNGLKIIDLPKGSSLWELKLNGNGQIAGVSNTDSIYRAFYWDPNFGLWELESSTNQIYVTAFNDKGQVLGSIGDKMFLWDHGKKTNLTVLFQKQVPGNWNSISTVALNNHGHVAFNAYESKVAEPRRRCFLWKDDCFKMILPEITLEDEVNAMCLDDDGNMIVYTYPRKGGSHSFFFISESRNIFASCPGCELIRNGLPIVRDRLNGQLKKDVKGRLYFSNGLQIKKMFKEEYPYYNISNSTDICDQNSRGYVVGTIDTMFPGRHAFLAIPEIEREDE
jgi:hypothetical protein